MNIKTPFFIVNPKSYLYGDELKELAIAADKFSVKYNVTVFFTVPTAELNIIAELCTNLIITAQHLGNITIGDSMGKVFAESLYYAGARAAVINHADNLLTFPELVQAIEIARKNNIVSIVCTNTLVEAELMAYLNPNIILTEETDLIGTKKTSSDEYVRKGINRIKTINPNVLVEQGAGIRTEEDVARLLELGSDGVGVTSGIIKAKNPIKMMESMIKQVSLFNQDLEE